MSTDTPTLAVAIMAHPRRRERAGRLARKVDADLVVFDEHDLGEWSTGAYAWHFGAQVGASHVLVLQDDAEPVDDLRRHVLGALGHVANSPVSLYLGQKKPSRWAPSVAEAVETADTHGATWITARNLLHGVALVLPTPWVTPMLQWCQMHDTPYDQRIGAYLRACRGKDTAYTWPSLVDHADDIPSLVRHADDARLDTGGRVAYRVGVPEAWNNIAVAVVTPPGAEQ